MGLIINCSFYCLNIYFIGQAYWSFRKTGGIKGVKATKELTEDRIAKKAGVVLDKAGNYVENKVDLEHQRQANEDA